MNLKYYSNLNGVRGVAAIMIMVCHFFAYVTIEGKWLQILASLASFGQTGVSLFFVLSGFLITRILLQAKSKTNYFKTFFIRRALRILPLYYVFLLVFYYLFPYLTGQKIVSLHETWYYYVYLQNLALTFNWNASGPLHYWTLAVEEHFYLLWPFVVYFISKENLKKVVFGILLIAILVRFGLILNDKVVYCFTFSRFDALAIGGLLATLENNLWLSSKRKSFFILISGASMLLLLLLWSMYSGDQIEWIQVFKFSLLAVFYFSVLGFLLCINPSSWINRLLETSFLQTTGQISYGLYVFHPVAFILIIQFWMPANTNIGLLFLLSFGLTYLLATLSFRFIEQPFLRLKKRWEY